MSVVRPFAAACLALVALHQEITYAAPKVIVVGEGTSVVEAGRVLVLPFRAISPNNELDWVGRAVQQSLISDLAAKVPGGVSESSTPAEDADDAIKAAAKAEAKYVVFGGYQGVNGSLRLTGQLLDVQQKRAIAGLKATGNLDDIFQMEDSLSMQIKRAILTPATQPAGGGSSAGAPVASDVAVERSGPLQIATSAEPPDAALTYAQPYVYTSDALNAGAYRYAYGSNLGYGLYYGYGNGYWPCGYGYYSAGYCSVHFGCGSARPCGGGLTPVFSSASSGIGGGSSPGQPTPSPIFGSSMFTLPVGPVAGFVPRVGSTSGRVSGRQGSGGAGSSAHGARGTIGAPRAASHR